MKIFGEDLQGKRKICQESAKGQRMEGQRYKMRESGSV